MVLTFLFGLCLHNCNAGSGLSTGNENGGLFAGLLRCMKTKICATSGNTKLTGLNTDTHRPGWADTYLVILSAHICRVRANDFLTNVIFILTSK